MLGWIEIKKILEVAVVSWKLLLRLFKGVTDEKHTKYLMIVSMYTEIRKKKTDISWTSLDGV